MSVRILSLVWDNYPGGGTNLLAILALADWSDDTGRCWPSMSSISKKIRLSRSQSQRVVHGLINEGFVKVIGNNEGGAKGASRRYQIVLNRLTGSAHATGSVDATGSAHAQEGSHACADTGSAHATQTVIEPSRTVKKVSSKKNAEITLKQFLDNCKEKSEQAIPEDDPVFAYAESVGLDHEMVSVCWQEFKATYLPKKKRYSDWRKAFNNAVRGNYYGLWFCKEDEPMSWTSKGQQARRAAA